MLLIANGVLQTKEEAGGITCKRKGLTVDVREAQTTECYSDLYWCVKEVYYLREPIKKIGV